MEDYYTCIQHVKAMQEKCRELHRDNCIILGLLFGIIAVMTIDFVFFCFFDN